MGRIVGLVFFLTAFVGYSTAQQFVSFSQFSQAVRSNGYPTPSQQHFNNFNTYARSLGKISSVEESAMALAQILHESGGFRYKREIACQKTQCPTRYRTPGCDAKNQYYYGRGYIQLTWCYNYKPASLAIFRDDRLVRDPDMVARDENVAWQTTFWFWGTSVHNRRGVSEGKFGVTTRAINSGECRTAGNKRAQARFRIYGNVRKAFGLPGAGDPSGCP